MRIPDSDDRVTLTRKEADEASKTLGVFIAMDGNQTAEVEYLREKGKDARSFSLVDFLTAPFQRKAKKPWSTDGVSHGPEVAFRRNSKL